MNVALVIGEHIKCYADLESYLWRPDAVEDKTKNICGLFVTVVEKKVYLIHQTAREFLLDEDLTNAGLSPGVGSAQIWRRSIYARQAHLVMARTCIHYLCMQDEAMQDLPGPDSTGAFRGQEDIEGAHVFLSYAAMHWTDHLREAHTLIDDSLAGRIAFTMCDPHGAPFRLWSTIDGYLQSHRAYWLSEPHSLSNVSVSTILGIESAVKLLLEQSDVELAFGDAGGRTPLHVAAIFGRTAVARLLLERDGSLANIKDQIEYSPLHISVRTHKPDFVQLLVETRDVDLNLRDHQGFTPLQYAAEEGYETIVRLLLKRQDVQIDPRNYKEETPLHFAARNGRETVVRLLLDGGAQPNVEDCEGLTPIDRAELKGHQNVVKLLEGRGVRVNVSKVNARKAIELQERDT